MIRHLRLTVLLTLLIVSGLQAQDKYRKYDPGDNYEVFLKITVNKKTAVFTFHNKFGADPVVIRSGNEEKLNDTVYVMDEPFLCRDGFILDGKLYPLDLIDKVRIRIGREGDISINFLTRLKDQQKLRRKPKNIISIFDQNNIDSDRFIRGAVVGLWSDINVDGEINEDVVSIFGDITIGENAMIRGDVVAVSGKIKADGKATVYGVLASSSDKKGLFRKWQKWGRRDEYFSLIGGLYYNRVDGAAPYAGVRFIDEDSVLPTVTAYGGYAFASERGRYHFGMEQTFFESRPITIGAMIYQRLASADDWLISETENTAFALLATEDYKDYYEAEGAYGFVRWTPFRGNSYEVGLRGERHRWLDAHPGLWSLFGGSKQFPDNYHGIDENLRPAGIARIDDKDHMALETRVSLNTLDSENGLENSFWDGFAEIEWSPDDWSGDYDFTRYLARICRYQRLNRHTGLALSGTYGTSEGTLPLNRTFFLGGMGTLYGYREKEYSGTEFWMGDLEYHIDFPNTEMGGWVFYNVGQITDDPGSWDGAEVKHSLGIGLSAGNDIRMNITQRLDRSGASPRLNIRISRMF